MMGGPPRARGGGARPSRKERNRVLRRAGINSATRRFGVIRWFRTLTTWASKEAKDLVEGVPSKVKEEGVLQGRADKIKRSSKRLGPSVRNQLSQPH